MKEKLKTSQTWGETGTFKFTKLKDHPHYLNAKQSSPTHITIKLSKFKNKERILKQQEDKIISHKGTPIKLSVDFLAETLQARRQQNDIFKMLKEKNCQPRILHLAKLSFGNDGEIKTLPDTKINIILYVTVTEQ